MKIAHTPGPWKLYKNQIDGENSWRVMHTNFEDCEMDVAKVRCDSDAHLIAAAPDLLKALEIAHVSGVARLCSPDQINTIEKALIKARGES